jgi:hypothetical protein
MCHCDYLEWHGQQTEEDPVMWHLGLKVRVDKYWSMFSGAYWGTGICGQMSVVCGLNIVKLHALANATKSLN